MPPGPPPGAAAPPPPCCGRPRSCGPAGRPAERGPWRLGDWLAQERREREALASLREDLRAEALAVDARVRRAGEDSVAALRSELDARLAEAAEGPAAAALQEARRVHEASLAGLRADVEARLAEIEEGSLAAILERERNERDACFAVLRDEMEARLPQAAEGLVANLLRTEHEASLEALRCETRHCIESLQSEASLRDRGAEAGVHIGSLVEQERHDREASMAALRCELDVRLMQMASRLEQESHEHQTSLIRFQQELNSRLACLGDVDVVALLEQERGDREASLAALHREMDAQLARVADQQVHEVSSDFQQHDVAVKRKGARSAACKLNDRIARALAGQQDSAAADVPDSESDVTLNICEVHRLLSKQQTEAAKMEGQLERFRRDITNSMQVLKLQVAQVEQVSSTLDMDIRVLKESSCSAPRIPSALTSVPPEARSGTASALEGALLPDLTALPRPKPSPSQSALATPLSTHESLAGSCQAQLQERPRSCCTAEARPPSCGREPLLPDDRAVAMELPKAEAKSPVLEESTLAPDVKASGQPDGGSSFSTFSHEVTAKAMTVPLPRPPPPLAVPMSLNGYLLRDLGAEHPSEHPVGYKAGSDGDKELLIHRGSGVKLRAAPLQLAGALDTDMLLYYYTDRGSFHAICEALDVLVTLLEQAKQGCKTFGAGVYMTVRAPEHFGTKSAVLINLYSNAADRATQLRHIEPHCGKADYCIPFLVRRCHVKDVTQEATPEMPFGAGYTSGGEYIQPDRDIRVVAIDPVEEAVRQLEDPAAEARARAARSLRELATRSDGRAVAALLPRLGAERDAAARAAAAGALGEVAQRGDARACAALRRCLGAAANDAPVREAAALALGKVAPRADGQAVEALARCLDGDPDVAVRASAAFVLGRLAVRDDLRAIEALTYRFEDEDEDERVSAVAGQALKRLGMDVEVEDEVDDKSCIMA